MSIDYYELFNNEAMIDTRYNRKEVLKIVVLKKLKVIISLFNQLKQKRSSLTKK